MSEHAGEHTGEAAFTIGSPVACQDGTCGVLQRVVVDPVKRALTHLVVEPAHGQQVGRLVPVELVDESATRPPLQLRCTMAAFDQLEDAEETKFLPGPSGGQWGYGRGQMMSMPFFGLGGMGMGMGGMGMGGMGMGGMGMGGMGMGGMGMGGMGMGMGPQSVTYDKVPAGEVEVRRGQHALASDGSIGHVRGLVVDPSDHQVTHVLLEEGHLWGKKEVAIPISAVASVDDDGVHLHLTKQEVGDLPPVGVEHAT